MDLDLDLRKKIASGFDLDLRSLTGFGSDLDLRRWWICTPLIVRCLVGFQFSVGKSIINRLNVAE